MSQNLSGIFNSFAGKEISVVERVSYYKYDGHEIPLTSVSPVENEPTLKALKTEAAKAGLSLRVWFPGTVGTMDYRTDRLNVHVSKEADGKYRIQNNFNIG